MQFRLHSTEAIRPVRPIACRISPSRPMRYATDTKYSMYNVQAVMFLRSFSRMVLAGIHSKKSTEKLHSRIHTWINRLLYRFRIGHVQYRCSVSIGLRQPTALGRYSQYFWRVPKGKVSSTLTASRDRVAAKRRATLKPCRAGVIT